MPTNDRTFKTLDEAIAYRRNTCAIASDESLKTLLREYTNDLESLIRQKMFTEICWQIVREEQMRREKYGDY